MSSLPCLPGCTCGKHQHVQQGRPCLPGCTCRRHDPEVHERISQALTGVPTPLTDASRASKSEKLQGNTNRTGKPHSSDMIARMRREWGKHFRGGETGDRVAKVLEPLGFIREFRLEFGPRVGGRFTSESYQSDFANPDERIWVELDGPFHYATPVEDGIRDEYLRSIGWTVIRIPHA